MSSQTLNARLVQRNDTKANWTTTNPVMLKGEMGVESDTGKFKFGDGTTAWVSLAYAGTVVADSTVNGNVKIDGVENVVYTLPIGATVIGGVKSSTGTNAVTIDAAGNMSITKASNAVLADTATKLATARTIAHTGDVTGSAVFDGSANISIATTLAASGATAGTYPKVTVNAKGLVTAGAALAAGDIPSLDASKITSGVIDAARLPSYVDDVLEVANYAALPATGETGKIYVTTDMNKQYRWSGSVYVQITSGAVDSVNGKTGVVALASTDLSDGAVVCKTTDTFIVNCGNA